MVSCQDVLEALGDLLDDRLAADLRRRIEAHMAECRTCTVLIDSSRKTLRIVTESGALDVPPDLAERVAGRVLAQLKKV